MKIAKISNKPISVLLSVLVVLLSFAATGAFSISASADETNLTVNVYGDFNGWNTNSETFTYINGRYEHDFSPDDYPALKKGSQIEFKYRVNGDDIVQYVTHNAAQNIPFTNGTSSSTVNLDNSVKTTLNEDFTSLRIWIKGIVQNTGINSCGIEYINEPKDVFTLSFNNGEDVDMTKTDSGYTCTVENVGKGNSIPYIIKKNGAQVGTSHPVTVSEWCSTVTINCDSDGNSPKATVTPPTYVIVGDTNEQNLVDNTAPNSDSDAYKLTYSDGKYTSNPFSASGDGAKYLNNKTYSYKIARNGAAVVSNKTVTVKHDNSQVVITMTVSGLDNSNIETKFEETGPTYTCTYESSISAQLSFSEKNNRYEATFTWEDEDKENPTLTFTGSANATVEINDTVKNGATITVWYDEANHDFDFEVKNPDEHNYGDLNGDGEYNVIDAYIIRKIADTNGDEEQLKAIGLAEGTNSVEYKLADVNGDGSVNQGDVKFMNDYIVGNITETEKENIGDPYPETP